MKNTERANTTALPIDDRPEVTAQAQSRAARHRSRSSRTRNCGRKNAESGWATSGRKVGRTTSLGRRTRSVRSHRQTSRARSLKGDNEADSYGVSGVRWRQLCTDAGRRAIGSQQECLCERSLLFPCSCS